MLCRLALFVLPLVVLVGCTSSDTDYERMTAAVAPETGLQQTQLAHIGHVETADGRFEVAVQRLVLTGMLAPRGQKHLVMFTDRGELVARYWIPDAEPLWCEGGRLYLFGFGQITVIPIDPSIADRFEVDEVSTGNVVDFSRGLEHAVLLRENRYGSSGGIEDDMWEGR